MLLNTTPARYFLIIVGSISLGFGLVGIVLPILPTTPFLLLSAFCYLRGSKKLYNWLINHQVFGSYIRNYITQRAIPRRARIVALLLQWVSLGACILLFLDKLYLKLLLIIIGAAVSAHLLRLKTI